MRKWLIFVLIFALVLTALVSSTMSVQAYTFTPSENVKCSILTDASGKVVLYEQNADEKRPVASIVKLMTIYLTLKEIDEGRLTLSDKVTVSERASSMGGSQIFLDTGSEHSVENLLKSVIISSANDSSVALAEKVAGSESAFVERMNAIAKTLGMDNTHYVNVNGLPAPEQYSTARDVARLMAEVSKYDTFRAYSQIRLEDYVHPTGRTTQMANTNKLLRTNLGIECGKTGSTVEAGYCFATRASRNGLTLIAVVLKAENSKSRFAHTSELLEYGYNNYESRDVVTLDMLAERKVGIAYTDKIVPLVLAEEYKVVSPKGENANLDVEFSLPTFVRDAKKGERIGCVTIYRDGVIDKTIDILSADNVKGASYIDNFKSLVSEF